MRVSGPVHSNSGDLNSALAAGGVGIALEPDFIVGEDLRAGRLVPLLPDYPLPPSPIYAVYPTRKHLSAKVRVFVDYLVERFAATTDGAGTGPLPAARAPFSTARRVPPADRA